MKHLTPPKDHTVIPYSIYGEGPLPELYKTKVRNRWVQRKGGGTWRLPTIRVAVPNQSIYLLDLVVESS